MLGCLGIFGKGVKMFNKIKFKLSVNKVLEKFLGRFL